MHIFLRWNYSYRPYYCPPNRKKKGMSVVLFTKEPAQDYELMVLVEKTLRRLHITGKLLGLRYLVYAVTETVKDPSRTQLITKDMYPAISNIFYTEAKRVERAIRSAVEVCWNCAGRDELDQMAGYHLDKRPTNTEFIDLVAAYIRYRQPLAGQESVSSPRLFF